MRVPADRLQELARRFETSAFLDADPSRFMHEVEGDLNREATAFVASSLSFGSRRQFMPRISSIVESAEGNVDGWIRKGLFSGTFRPDDKTNFYRFFTRADMYGFFSGYSRLMRKHGSLGEFVKARCKGDGFEAVKAICSAFASSAVVPADARSCCKRICMFLRWMVRDSSPVDLGLWSEFVDKRTLVIPMDVHVRDEARKLGLLESSSASMAAARRLTARLKEVFPDDPLKADFALFGIGVSPGPGVHASNA